MAESATQVAAGLLIAAEAGCDTIRYERTLSVGVLAAAPGLAPLLRVPLELEH